MEIQINVQEAVTIALGNVEKVVHHHNHRNNNVKSSDVKLPTIKQQTHLAIEPPRVEIDANQIAVAAGILESIDEDLKRKKQEVFSIVKAIPVKESDGDMKVTSSITALFEALLAIFALSSESRKLAAQQRQVANQANINSIQAQAAELRKGAIAMLVVAAVGAAVAVISTSVGAKNVLGAHKNLKVTREVTRDISLGEKQLHDLDQMNEAGQDLVRVEAIRQLQPKFDDIQTRYPSIQETHKTQIDGYKKDLIQHEVTTKGNQLAADKAQQLQSQIADKRLVLTENELAGRVSDATSYAVNASSQAVSTAVSGFGQAAQGWTNASAKELEANSAQWQHILEVIKEMLQSDDQILSQMTQSFQQISDSLLSAWKQGTTLA